MSEEILKALMQLFALIVKQDDGMLAGEKEYVESFLSQQLNQETANEYLQLFEEQAQASEAAAEEAEGEEAGKKKRLTSVKDSVRVLGICKKITKTLTQEQKVVSLLRLFELVNAERNFTPQRMAIINACAQVFKVSAEEFKSIETFVLKDDQKELDLQDILLVSSDKLQLESAKFIDTSELQGIIAILRVPSVDLYFLKYTGNEALLLNGLVINNRRIYLFAGGSSVKMPKGKPVYYSDVVAHFLADSTANKISFEVNDLSFKFPNGHVGLRNVSFNEGHGKLIGIMGASGAGKTTLLNVLCGLEKPSEGNVLINGLNLHNEKKKLEGVIGYIPQDDLLIEELTVFENLYFNAKLCFRDKPEKELVELVHKTLHSLGLLDRKDLKVGSPLNKTISGGQRKRLNIALELLREPSILFVDEPTSGLSSNDSENVMDLLRELVLKGKLIFVVIHQPSSDIYKMFDKMIILDTGGYLIYYGNPVEAVMYFKRIDQQINSDVGECQICGNVNPELIFSIIEARVVDEFGRYTDNRKISPPRWEELYLKNFTAEVQDATQDEPPKTLRIPGWFKQMRIYTVRDFFSKISNKQYMMLTMLEAPVLGFILAYVIRYIADPMSDVYIFRENENIPIFIFMSLIVSLFLGLIVSAEEIFRDRKILKREAFLNLSKSSYLISKIFILFAISALQAIMFVAIANTILEVRGMYFTYWLALFSTAVFANMLGLNISSTFNSAVTIYIIIPLLMIPMMVLSGAMFSFDKLNRNVGSINKVPLVAEFMVTRWSYEALMVHQFKDNRFDRLPGMPGRQTLYDIQKRESMADYRQVYLMPELDNRLNMVMENLTEQIVIEKTANELNTLHDAVQRETMLNPNLFFNTNQLLPDRFNSQTAEQLRVFLDAMDMRISEIRLRYDLCVAEFENLYAERNARIAATFIPRVRMAIMQENIILYDTADDMEWLFDVIQLETIFNSDADSIDLSKLAPDSFDKETAEQLKIFIDKMAERYEVSGLYALLDQCIEEIEELYTNVRLDDNFNELRVLNSEIRKELSINPFVEFDVELLTPENFNLDVAIMLEEFLESMNQHYIREFERANTEKETTIAAMLEIDAPMYARIRNAYQNEHLGEIVRKSFEKNKILEFNGEMVQQMDPIYKDPTTIGKVNVRTHFFAPRKYFLGKFYDTYWFNISVIWIYTFLLYIVLYFDGIKKMLDFFGKISFKKK